MLRPQNLELHFWSLHFFPTHYFSITASGKLFLFCLCRRFLCGNLYQVKNYKKYKGSAVKIPVGNNPAFCKCIFLNVGLGVGCAGEYQLKRSWWELLQFVHCSFPQCSAVIREPLWFLRTHTCSLNLIYCSPLLFAAPFPLLPPLTRHPWLFKYYFSPSCRPLPPLHHPPSSALSCHCLSVGILSAPQRAWTRRARRRLRYT